MRELANHVVDGRGGIAQREAGLQIEGNGRGRQLTEMIHRQRPDSALNRHHECLAERAVPLADRM